VLQCCDRGTETFPHHLRDGAEDHVVSHSATTGLEVLQHLLEEAGVREQNRESIFLHPLSPSCFCWSWREILAPTACMTMVTNQVE
jgi:hypothetical protein